MPSQNTTLTLTIYVDSLITVRMISRISNQALQDNMYIQNIWIPGDTLENV